MGSRRPLSEGQQQEEAPAQKRRRLRSKQPVPLFNDKLLRPTSKDGSGQRQAAGNGQLQAAEVEPGL